MQNILIHQRYDDDCGIAALAMLLEAPYETVYNMTRTLYPDFNGMHFKMARVVCKHLGHSLACREVKPTLRWYWAEKFIDAPCVLICPEYGTSGMQDRHAVYWTGNKLLDPTPNNGKYRRYGKQGKKAWNTVHDVWFLFDQN